MPDAELTPCRCGGVAKIKYRSGDPYVQCGDCGISTRSEIGPSKAGSMVALGMSWEQACERYTQVARQQAVKNWNQHQTAAPAA